MSFIFIIGKVILPLSFSDNCKSVDLAILIALNEPPLITILFLTAISYSSSSSSLSISRDKLDLFLFLTSSNELEKLSFLKSFEIKSNRFSFSLESIKILIFFGSKMYLFDSTTSTFFGKGTTLILTSLSTYFTFFEHESTVRDKRKILVSCIMMQN